jgi:hydroxylaminobenzene mutase
MFAVPRLGLSTHLLGVMQGLFLLILGLLWPRLTLSRGAGQVGVVLALYGCFAAWTANFAAASLGAGNSILPIAAGSAHGSSLQEMLIVIGLRSAGVSLIAVTVLVLWGLRNAGTD